MSTATIKPTPGRVVWYRGTDGYIRPAIVTVAWGNFDVNLYVFGQTSVDPERGSKESVTHADPEQEPGCFPSWHWMPYQVEQAKKAEEREQAAKDIAIAGLRDYEGESRRAQVLELALRTPGLHSHQDVLQAAAAYQAHIEGRATVPVQQPGQLISEQPAPGTTLPPHQQRVLDEKRDLDEKLAKLDVFLDTPVFTDLPLAEQLRLQDQSVAMHEYAHILADRIDAFAPVNESSTA